MTIAAGTRLGPYEILSPIGAGGMGEVYRARDERLGRDVAVKVLPADVAADAERLKRFDREARSASALNHPNIVTVYDVGMSEGVAWIAMELVEGETLRKMLAGGPLPLKKLLGCATQIAEGLAKAHATGIVHRDLKPENVMVTPRGLGQDPGLRPREARRAVAGKRGAHALADGIGRDGVRRRARYGGLHVTRAGARGAAGLPLGPVLVRIDPVRDGDREAGVCAPQRSRDDGRHHPRGARAARGRGARTPAPLRWIVERCLAKDREERYASTKDLARDLARLREGLSQGSLSGGSIPARVSRRGAGRGLALAAATLVAGAAIAVVATRPSHGGPPRYRPVSFHRGALGIARFAPDDKTILYTAAWEGRPPQIYSTRLDSTESTALPLPSANLLSVSSAGMLAILAFHGNDPPAIAEVSLAGGAPRELFTSERPDAIQFAEGVADFRPGEDRLAIVRNGQLEFPAGKVLVPASNEAPVTALRFSPDGRRIAFTEYRGGLVSVGVVDLAGSRKILSSGWEIVSSLAWNPSTGEIWFSARKKDASIGVVALHAVSLSGAERLVAQTPQLLIVQDVARDGRVLARSDDWPETMMCLAPGASREVDLTWLDFSEGVALSADGQDLLFIEGGAGAGATGGVYLRKTDGSAAAVRLGDGWNGSQDLSPDRKWVVQAEPDRLILLPVGPGEPKTIQDKDFKYARARWFPDGQRLLIRARAAGGGARLYVRDVSGGAPRAISPEGVLDWRLSPDGKLAVAADAKTGRWTLYPTDAGEARPLPGVREGEGIAGFDATSSAVYVVSGDLVLRIERLDLATGKRAFFREISPSDRTGVAAISALQLTPDGKSYCYSFMRSLSRLYVIDGLR